MADDPKLPEDSQPSSAHEPASSMVPNQTGVTTTTIGDAELHYKSLTEYLKYLVTLTFLGIGVFITVGLYVGYKDMSAMRAEVRQTFQTLRQR